MTQCISRLCTSGDHLVIASIHQPRAAIWDLFNRVVLLSEGYTLYCGPTADVRPLPRLSSCALSTWTAASQLRDWTGQELAALSCFSVESCMQMLTRQRLLHF